MDIKADKTGNLTFDGRMYSDVKNQLLERVAVSKLNIDIAQNDLERLAGELSRAVLEGTEGRASELRSEQMRKQGALLAAQSELSAAMRTLDEITAAKMAYDADKLLVDTRVELVAALTKYDDQIEGYRQYLASNPVTH